MAEVKHGNNKFYVGDSEENFDAVLSYVPAGTNRIIIDHTEVDESLSGQGVGSELVKAAVEYARENDIKIHATCPFAKGVLNKTESYHDVFEM